MSRSRWACSGLVGLVVSLSLTAAAPAAAQTATATVGSGSNPYSVAVNPVTNKIYVANSGSANVTVIDGATNAITTVAVGTNPLSVAVNPVTNKIYVANYYSNNVTVIDGATNATTTVVAGMNPRSVAVNPVTNKIYVANSGSANVTVIDGATNATTTVAAGSGPFSVAVNPVTNKIYVANNGSANVTVIDGATNATTTVAAGSGPNSVAVNPVTNKIYVANYGSANVTVIDGATNATTTVAVGTNPQSVAVNPVTNKIYVANYGSANVTVIDGATNATTTVAAGTYPFSVAVNPVTNKIYVANYGSANVTVIDGATNATTTVAAGTYPFSVAVNPVTNKIYVANYGSANVTVIDGATNATTTVAAGSGPQSVAVNPVTNKIYVANYYSNNVTVIDGATNATTTVAAGAWLQSVAVNPVTNRIYVANNGSANVTVIDGATNATTTVAAGGSPKSVAVNPVTNKIYVANYGSANVTVIDGATNATTTVAAGTSPFSVAVNPVTNKIYVANLGSANVTVIDGATNATTTVAAYPRPDSVAVNPVTNKIYVANYNSANVTALTEQAVSTIPLTMTISPLAGDVAYSTTPTFTLSAASAFAPTAPPVQGVFTQVDTWQGSWQAATPSAGVFTATTSPLGAGTHVLYAYAVDGQDGTGSSNSGSGTTCSPLVGSIAAYVFTVVPPVASVGGPQTICAGGTTSSLGGNTPAVGETGLWSVESGGTGTFAPASSAPNATFTHTGGTGPVLLRWTVSHPPFGASSATVSVTVKPVPAAPTAGSNSPRCAGSTLSLTASTVTGAVYAWTGPNGFTSSLQNPALSGVTLAAAGTYSVTVTVGGCTSPAGATTVVVNPKPATPVLTAPATAYPSKAGLAASVESHAGASYQWSITNGSITSGQGTSSITFTAGSVGQTVLSVVETSGLGCVSAAGVAAVTVESGIFIPATGGAPNTRVDVPVNAASVSGLVAAALTVGYDPAALHFASVRTGLLTPGWALLANAANAGEIRLALASASGMASGTGALLYIAFDVIGSPGSTSSLTLSSVSLNDGAIAADVTNGTFRIDVLRNISGSVGYWNRGAGVPGVSLSLSGERVYSTSSSATGGFTVGGLEGQNYVLEPSKSDEANGIGTLDASLILQHVVGLTTLTGYAALAADVNEDGSISAMDAFLVLQKAIDAITLPFPGAGRVWAFSPASRSYDALSADQAGQDFTAVLIGDVNGSWAATPPAAKTGPAPFAAGPEAATSEVALKVGNVLSCGTAAIPVAVTVIPPGAKVLGVVLRITYDPAAMTISSVTAAGDAVGWAIASRQPELGTLLVALAGASELAGPGPILLLSTTRLKDGKSVVSLPSVSVNDGEIPASGAPGDVTFVSAIPVVTASSTGPACEGSDVQFSTQVILGASCSWSGPNGFSSNEVLPTLRSVTQAMAGKYTVTVSGVGCTPVSASTDLLVNQRPAAPTITSPSSALQGAAGLIASVPSHTGSTWQWSVTNGSITSGQGTSSISFTAGSAGQTTLTVVETNSLGCVSAAGAATVTVLPAGSAGLFYTVTPCRVLDTRNQIGPLGAPPLQPGATRTFDPSVSTCGIPADAVAISANLTVTNVGASGELVVFPADVLRPNTSALSFRAGRTRANNAIVSFSNGGTTFSIFNNSAATVDFILDVNGFFR